MEPKILYEDKEILVISKPSGMVVNNAQSVVGETVQDWIEEYQKLKIKYQKDTEFGVRSGVVHRLDKETSGVLLIAKTPEAFQELQKQFKDREVEKTYVALVHGAVAPLEGVIKAPLGRLPWNRERFGVLPGGREAETGYKVISVFRFQVPGVGLSGDRLTGKPKTDSRNPIPEYSLIEFYPKTGRTHQIRVHAKSIGHPVVSDTFYAGRKTARNDRKWCPRLFLHASKISLTHPGTGKRMTVEAPMDEKLATVLKKLQ